MLEIPLPGGVSFDLCRPLESDARQVMIWRNDPITLSMFYHREPKIWDSFWPEFRDTYFLNKPSPVFARVQGQRVAFLRFESARDPRGLSGHCVDISINLAPEWRGRGLGTVVLRAASGFLRTAGIDTICAEVRTDNLASVNAFTGSGYQTVDEMEKLVTDTGETVSIRRFVLDLISM
jgi:N-acetylneuraminate synthase